MDLPVIDTPVAPRWVWMEEVTYSHIPIATLITAFLVLAPIFEYIGYRIKDARYDRLAKSLVYFSMILYSPGAALGTGIPMFIIGLWPEFWHRWANLFFWPLILQFIFFLIDVGFLFFGYYLCWDRWQNKKRLHITFGVITAIFGLAIQAVWDSLGGYMTTPGGVPLPGIDQPVGWSWGAILNPSFPFLFWHRFFGNISYTMLLVGGVFAYKYWKKTDPEEKAYFGWASDLTFTIGFLTFFIMPFIGWGFARVLQLEAPIVHQALMGGFTSHVFNAKMILIGVMITLGGAYIFIRHNSNLLKGLASLGLVSLWMVLQWHPAVDWFGSEGAWRMTYTIGIMAFIAFLWWGRYSADYTTGFWKWTMFTVGIVAFFVFCLGGFAREAARQPYTVYNEIIKPEVTPLEADRWLTYDKCLGCHHLYPKDLDRYAKKDWAARVALERQRPGARISDAEAVKIIGFLNENYGGAAK